MESTTQDWHFGGRSLELPINSMIYIYVYRQLHMDFHGPHAQPSIRISVKDPYGHKKLLSTPTLNFNISRHILSITWADKVQHGRHAASLKNAVLVAVRSSSGGSDVQHGLCDRSRDVVLKPLYFWQSSLTMRQACTRTSADGLKSRATHRPSHLSRCHPWVRQWNRPSGTHVRVFTWILFEIHLPSLISKSY